jgi:predicted membrane-bound spermidine synthase
MSLLWALISRIRPVARTAVLTACTLIFIALFSYSESLFPVIPKLKKREYLSDYLGEKIEYSQWSPINKIDIAPESKFRKNLWLNGGTQQSWLVRHNRQIEKTKKPIMWFHQSIPFQLTRNGSAFIIGSAGGYEVLCALTHKFRTIYAVEMDPVICHIISNTKYSDYIGKIFRRKGVHLIADEGRSVLKRMKDSKFDVIQMVNSHPTDTLLSGGLSVAETYIYTVESMQDFWHHLHDEGFLSIVHVFGERLFTTAFEALRELGIEEPEKKFFIIQAKTGFNYFFMKRGNIDEEDTATLTKFAEKLRKMFPVEIVYAPHLQKDNTYYQLASPAGGDLIKRSSVDISPVRDNSPYFNQPNKIGQFRFKNNYIAGLARLMIGNALSRSNSVYLSILAICLLFSFLLIYLPLRLRRGDGKVSLIPILYFFFIGLAFIVVEIILIKIFQLFLGNPAYSISVIIFSLLLSSGVGSLLSGRFTGRFGNRAIPFLTVLIVLVLVLYSFLLFPIVYSLIHLGLFFRFFLSLLLISILGIPMGVFFPTGLKHLGAEDRVLIGWAWGGNAFATVLGSVVAVITAINWNFTVTLLTAAVAYAAAGLAYKKWIK